jgi:hypothetical protein
MHSHGALNWGAVDENVSLEMILTGAGASARSRGLDDKYLSGALSAAELIRKGCTACLQRISALPSKERSSVAHCRLRANGGGVLMFACSGTACSFVLRSDSDRPDEGLGAERLGHVRDASGRDRLLPKGFAEIPGYIDDGQGDSFFA